MQTNAFRQALLMTVLVCASAQVGLAQPGRPKANVTAVTESTPAKAGCTVRVSLNVTLPDDVHVQSDKPRDASLIPTVLTVDTPAGVTVAKVAYPTAAGLTIK